MHQYILDGKEDFVSEKTEDKVIRKGTKSIQKFEQIMDGKKYILLYGTELEISEEIKPIGY